MPITTPLTRRLLAVLPKPGRSTAPAIVMSLVTAALLTFTQPLYADWVYKFSVNDNGYELDVYEDSDDPTLVEIENWKDGKLDHTKYFMDGELIHIDFGNPNPEGDDYPEPGDESSREALAKQEGGKQKAPAVNLVTKYQTANGQGLSVIWNPSDDEGGSGPHAPQGETKDYEKLEDEKIKKLLAKLKGMANGNVHDLQFNGESPADQVKGAIKNGEADDDNNSRPPGWKQAQMENARLGEVYNPNPEEAKSRGFLLMGTAPMAGNGMVTGNGAGAGIASFGTETLFKVRAYGPVGGNSPVTQPAAPRPRGRR